MKMPDVKGVVRSRRTGAGSRARDHVRAPSAETSTKPPLLERERELADLFDAVEQARSGGGGFVVVEGTAGIGKTRLLDALRERADQSGLEVLRARGGALEQGFAFGVVRQLFEPRIASATEAERKRLLSGAARLAAPLFAADQPEDSSGRLDSNFAVLHGLYWLCTNLAHAAPLLLVIDDAHWADEPSLRFISFLVNRIEELPLLVAIAARAREPSGAALAEVTSASQVRRIQPGALSPDAIHVLVRRTLDPAAESDFSDACHRVTGGNPFLAGELLRELARERVAGRRDQIARLSELTPATVASSVVLRLSRMPQDAGRLADAVALLGDGVELHLVADVAGLSLPATRRMADMLADIEVLRPGEPLGFIHPLVRGSVYSELGPSARSEGHARAARVLHDAGADSERVVAQLMHAPPSRQAWAVAALRAAALKARGHGAPAAAIAYLRRALAEPPADEERADILCELGFAEAAVYGPTGLAPFREALALTEDPRRRAEIALEIGRMLAGVFYSKDAADVCQQGLEALGDDGGELAQQLEVQLVAAGITDLTTAARAADLLRRMRARSADRPPDPRLLAVTGCLMAGTVPPAQRGADLARRALADGRLLSQNPELVIYANLALLWADDFDGSSATCSQAAEQARRRGSQIELGWALVHSARAANRRGARAEAEADAREALELLDANGWEPPKAYAVAPVVDALIERGAYVEAHDLLAERGMWGALGTQWANNELLQSRANLCIAVGRMRDGLSDLLECGRRLDAWGKTRNPAYVAWRSSAAIALEALGDHAEAARLSGEEVALAREFDVPRALGVALRVAGIIEGGDVGIEMLREAVATLSGTAAQLELARALTDLGAALRRGGHRTQALEPLREGLDGARRSDATVLAERARAELIAAGAKPRRDLMHGREALTATEERIARMACGGQTNREIAQDLFVTMRTVETHLTHAYQKLGIRSRSELSSALTQAHQS